MFKPDQHNPFSDDLGYLGDYGLQPHTNPGIHPNPSFRVPLPNPPQVKEGDTGKAVNEMHVLLIDALDPKKTGWAAYFLAGEEFLLRKFGKETASKVKYFQASQGLSPDGIVGPKTWAALSRVSRVVQKQHKQGYYDTKTETEPSPTAPRSTLPAPPPSPPKQQKKTPIHQQEWFVPVVAGLSILIVGGLIIRSVK